MSYLNKPIKFAHLQKLPNQSMLHGAYLKEMAKTSTAVFIKARESSVFNEEWKMSIEKYGGNIYIYFLNSW